MQFLDKFKDLPIEHITAHTNIPTLTSEVLVYHSVRGGDGFERSSAAKKDGGFLLPADLDFLTGCQDHWLAASS